MASVMRARYGPLWVLLAGSASVMASSGCLWKDTVNELPLVKIEGPPAVHVGEEAKFSASFTNDKTGQMTFEWGRARDCPADVASARQTGGERKFGPTISWIIAPETPEPARAGYCTFVIARDDRGAEGFQKHVVALVNRKVVISVPAQVTSGMPAKYTATFSDDPAAASDAQFFWGSAAAMLPNGACQTAEESARENQRSLVVKTAEWESTAIRKPYCVVAIARDKFNAEYTGQQMVTNIINGGPPAQPRLVSPKEATLLSAKEATVGIFNQVRFAAAAVGELSPSDDLDFAWTVKRPDGTTMQPPGCDGALPPKSEVCFDVTGAGEYKVDLVTTEAGQTGMGSFALKVEDLPPCIRMTDPLVPIETGSTTVFSLDGEEKVLKVGQVVDDGDPLPSVGRASEGAFVWSIRLVDPEAALPEPGFQILPHAIFNSYTLPAGQFRLGDRVEVRVEYRDRLDLRDLKARDLSHCGDKDLSCPTRPGGACFLRVGWKVLYL
jgi:hypothetical protein